MNQNQPVNPIQNAAKEMMIKQYVKQYKDRFLTNPDELNALFTSQPELAEAIAAGDDKKIESFIRKKMDEAEAKERQRKMEYIKLMNSDPNDPNVQKKIEEIIKFKNIEENRKYAEEYLPETLFSVHMLYINLEINKKKVVALVDTGAQSTIMSQELVKKCDLENLVDTRYSGIATGVGTGRIIGTIHAAPIKLNGQFLMVKITVLENPTIGFIFGLDNMRAHRCNVDLGKNALVFPDAKINVMFLSDGEIKKIKEEDVQERENEMIKKAKEESLKDKDKGKKK